MSDERIARMQCPVGLAGVSGKQPEIIALAVVAQLMQHATTISRRGVDESRGLASPRAAAMLAVGDAVDCGRGQA